jgi:putative peptidoglycan lipid II flippase
MSGSIFAKVGIASAIMMTSVFLSRVIGLLREMVIAYSSGAGRTVDAYQVAFVLPEILNHALASGFLSITFIPIFAGYLVQGREDQGWRVFSLILTVFGLLLLLLMVVFWVFTPSLLTVTGFRSEESLEQAIRLSRIMIPAQLFFFVGGLLMAVQFAKKRFWIPALAPLIYNIGIIVGGVLLGPRLGMEGFAWGVLGGAFVGNFLLQWIGAGRVGLRFRPCLQLGHPDLRRYLFVTLPLMFGLTITFSTEIFARLFGSYLDEGSVAGLNYSLRIMFVLVGVFGQAVGVASYPFLSQLAAERRFDTMNQLLNGTLKMLGLVIPLAVLMMVLRYEVVRLLFQRGSFDVAATELTAGILPFVLVGTFAFAAQTIVARGFYAMGNTLQPAVFCSLAVIASLPFYLIGMRLFGVVGIAIALALSALFQVILLFLVWNHKTGNTDSRAVYWMLFKIVSISILLGVGGEWFRTVLSSWFDVSTAAGCVGSAAVTSSVFLLCLVAAARILRIGEMAGLIDRLWQLFNKASTKSPGG